MKFLSDRMQHEFDVLIHPKLRLLLSKADEHMQERHGVDVTITCLIRTPAENQPIGVQRSWHLYGTGADLRSHGILKNPEWDAEVRAALEHWIESYISVEGSEHWEFIPSAKVHGTGPHIHIARRDSEWRDRYNLAKGFKPQDET